MKTKTIVTLAFTITLLLGTTRVFADNVFIKTPELKGKMTVTSGNLDLTDWQAVISCHFDNRGNRKESIRYPQTFVKSLGNNEYSLAVKKGSLSELLPASWRLLTCAYKLILIGKNTDSGKVAFGEIYLLGQEQGEMDPEELKEMQNNEYVAKVLNEKLQDLKISAAVNGGIVLE